MKSFFKKTYKKLIKLIFFILYGRVTISNKSSKSIKKILIKKKLFNNKNYFIYEIQNATIFTDNVQNVAAINNNKMYPPASFQHAKNKLVSAKFNPVLNIGTTKIKKKYKGTVLSLVQGASTENYFHWLLDILPKIKICFEKYSLNKIDYFYLSDLTISQTESLKYLGIKNKQILNSKIHNHIFADKIIFISHPWYNRGKFHDQSYKLPKWIISWIRTI